MMTDGFWAQGIDLAEPTIFTRQIDATEIAGTEYYDDAWDLLTKELDAGGEPFLSLLRDPENEFDPNAIQVLAELDNGENVLLGFVPKPIAAKINRKYANNPIFALVDDDFPDEPFTFENCFIDIYIKYSES